MIVEIRLDRNRQRAWMIGLLYALARDGFTPQIKWLKGDPTPVGLDSLLTLEHSLLRRFKPCGSDRIADSSFSKFEGEQQPDVIVDLSSAPVPPDGSTTRWLHVSFEGDYGENAAIAAILKGDLPQIEICDARTGIIIERGKPSGEIADGLGGALGAVMARTSTLVRAALSGKPRLIPPAIARIGNRPSRSPAAYVAGKIGAEVLKSIYRLCCETPNWRIGWRYTDRGIAERQNLSGDPWNTLQNGWGRMFADPFAVTWQGRQFVFAEEINQRLGRGIISAVEFGPHGPLGEMTPVLQEPWHLSYPFMIEHAGELWMIPESSNHGDIAIYRAARFPDRWERHTTLLSGIEAADATVIQHGGRFYMFAATRDEACGGYSDTLSIFHAADLFGPWVPHAANPIFVDRAAARPAGNFIRRGERLWRPLQDCSNGYGAALALAEITDLSPETYAQAVRAIIHPDASWPGRKIHTLNRSGSLEVIDGASSWPKLKRFSFGQERFFTQPAAQHHS